MNRKSVDFFLPKRYNYSSVNLTPPMYFSPPTEINIVRGKGEVWRGAWSWLECWKGGT